MEDAQIIELYWQRDGAAIEKTDEKYGSYCYTVANRILCSHEDSEECVSDTWLRAWNAMPPQRPQLLKMFLAAITRNLSFDRVKAAQAAKRGGGVLEVALDELAECADGRQSVESEAMASALGDCINTFLQTLPARERGVFLRRYFFVESAAEIAQRYALTPNGVNVMLHRTRQKLREALVREGYVV